MILIVPILVFLACLSPTLTLLALWQVKEWRFDRLTEHLKREGVLRQLFGTLRPTILITAIFIAATASTLADEVFVLMMLTLGLLGVLSTLTCVQIILGRQPMPIFTAKAGLMLVLSTLIPNSLPFLPLPAFILLPFLCPLWVLLSWLLTKPLDGFLKMRTLRKAKNLRLAHPHITVIGITGSIGKTTTKELLAHVLKKRGALATPVHVNSEMGVARWLTKTLQDKPADWNGTLIIEMGAYRKGEIKLLTEITKPQLGIITFIGSQHLSLFGSLEAIREAKGELFTALPTSGHAFMNRDNAASDRLKELCACRITTVGTDGKADLSALDIEETTGGLRFVLNGQQFLVPIAGTHTVTSILLAIAAAQKLGMELQDIRRELATFKPLERTFEVKHIRSVTVLDDTYNASPDSFRAAIAWAQSQPHREKVLLTDGIIELGESEQAMHSELSTMAATVFDRVCIGNPRFLSYFKNNGFGERAVLLSSSPSPINKDGLLVCIGRVPRTAIDELLPFAGQ
ncbi:UDP-N-acetylmuramoyl-tripeptide--D-alanyl-D-alanine ligase [Candidatus Peribacteria bacterium]|nr:UDP-N-acetylmuramoyl-tripeptide--D-alanyl-D-alanine ligase [Candidatus Peribacteria bacterium]